MTMNRNIYSNVFYLKENFGTFPHTQRKANFVKIASRNVTNTTCIYFMTLGKRDKKTMCYYCKFTWSLSSAECLVVFPESVINSFIINLSDCRPLVLKHSSLHNFC